MARTNQPSFLGLTNPFREQRTYGSILEWAEAMQAYTATGRTVFPFFDDSELLWGYGAADKSIWFTLPTGYCEFTEDVREVWRVFDGKQHPDEEAQEALGSRINNGLALRPPLTIWELLDS